MASAMAQRRAGHRGQLELVFDGLALVNKVARIVFVLMTRGSQYDDRPVAG